MDAIEVQKDRVALSEGVIVSTAIWRVPEPVRGSEHFIKYRLALIVDDVCVLRYDNEAGKGDLRHVGDEQFEYQFVGVGILRRDFRLEAGRWLQRHRRG